MMSGSIELSSTRLRDSSRSPCDAVMVSLPQARPECMRLEPELHRPAAVRAGPGEDRVDRLHVLAALDCAVGRHDHLRQDLAAEHDVAAFGIVGGMGRRVATVTEVFELQHCGEFSHADSFGSRARNATGQPNYRRCADIASHRRSHEPASAGRV